MTDSRAFYRTVFIVTVLSEGSYDPQSLSQIVYDTTIGAHSCAWGRTSSTPITADEMVQALHAQQSDPSFFGLGVEEEEEERAQRCCICGRTAEGGEEEEEVCDCTCPQCGTHTFDDVTLSDHGRCYDCQKQWQLRPAAHGKKEERA